MNALYDPKRKKKKIRKWLRTILIIVFVILACYVGQVVIDNTIGRFENIYDAIAFNNDFKPENIIEIIYNDSSALIFYKKSGNYGIDIYCYRNGCWRSSSGFSSQYIYFDGGILAVNKPRVGEGWFASVSFNSKEDRGQKDVIFDAESSVFYQCTDNIYYAAIHPTSENYQININGEDITIQLEGFKGKEK